MKIRNIPFGYRIENGTIHLHPTESQVVREIHAAYLDGQSLLQIAASLNERGVEYMPGAAAWNKARLKRIIEDVRYLGNETYPAIVKETDFYKAQEIKTARNTQKNVDRTADIFKLAVPVCCENCGEPMRRIHDSRTSHQEKWITAENQQQLLTDSRITELMTEKRKLESRLAEYAAAEQHRKNTASRLDQIFTILDGMKNHPLTYGDQVIRQILRCVVVESKEKIRVVFIGGLEVEAEVEY